MSTIETEAHSYLRAFEPAAEVYEEHIVPAVYEVWTQRLLDLAGPRTGERVLDIACGTGVVARAAATRVGPGGTVVGVDANPAMLDVARRVAENRAHAAERFLEPELRHAGIEWREVDAVSLPFDDASFDVVTCQQGLQFFADRLAALREMRRVTAPRGRVVIAVWSGPELNSWIERLARPVERYVSAKATAGFAAPFGFGDVDALRSLVVEAGFQEAHIRIDVGTARYASPEHMLHALGGAFAPFAAAVGALDDETRTALVEDVARAVHTYIDDDGVSVPMVSSVVRARP
ncbi:MAG: class I SAM-dependent methyltransferase [Actinomycetota bacterium]